MKEWLQRKSISKPVFLLMIILISITFVLHGGILILKMGIYSGIGVGDSMMKTLSNESKLLFIKSDFKEIKRGDLVTFLINHNGENIQALKRVIALPNETIKIKENNVYIDGELLDEPYAYYIQPSKDDLNLTVPSDGYFVMGDNRIVSLDSRILGAISKTSIDSVVLKFKK